MSRLRKTKWQCKSFNNINDSNAITEKKNIYSNWNPEKVNFQTLRVSKIDNLTTASKGLFQFPQKYD